MTAYTKSTNFATKDTLTSGDPLKIVKGTEINTEFDNIATAVNSKSDTASPTFTGTVTIPILSYAGTTLSAAVTGTGKMVLDTSPTLVTPALGTPASGVLTNCTGVQYNGFKNRIINGAMVIDQRNNGASYTATTGGLRYGVDRFFIYASGANLTGQQVAGTNTGTQKAFRITGATGSTACNFSQRIEAVNTYDMASTTVTASVKVYCSTSISNAQIYLLNPTATDNYASTTSAFATNITLNSGLNTIVVSGTNGANAIYGSEIGIAFNSGIGNGVSVDISSFQLEKGSTATSFDYRPYGTELALCQRYLPCMNGNTGERIPSIGANAAQAYTVFNFGVEPRVPPTGISVTTVGNFSLFNYRTGAVCGTITAITFATAGKLTGLILVATSSVAANDTCHLYPAASGQILFTGCEL
jgi:hypothetical protein